MDSTLAGHWTSTPFWRVFLWTVGPIIFSVCIFFYLQGCLKVKGKTAKATSSAAVPALAIQLLTLDRSVPLSWEGSGSSVLALLEICSTYLFPPFKVGCCAIKWLIFFSCIGDGLAHVHTHSQYWFRKVNCFHSPT